MFVCENKCFFRNRLWSPGETAEARDGEKMPRHFKPAHGTQAELKDGFWEVKTKAVKGKKPEDFID